MNLALKQRLVGASVLVALAVIFLPMLLDGSGRPERVDVSMEIPEEPKTAGGTTTASTSGGTGTSADTPGATETADDDAAGEAPDTASTGATETDQGSSNGQEASEPAETGEAEASSGASASDDEAAAEDGSTASAAGPSAWVVQVGSFARETNALVLRDKLRERGFEAFADQGRADGQRVWRVRVGPEATREEVEALKQRLLDARGGPALIMSYPD